METLIALGILVTGVLSIVGTSLLTIHTATLATDRVTGVNLAREGIELVRLVRDTNWLDKNQTWPYGLNDGSFVIDSESGDVLTAVSGNPSSVESCGSDCDLYLDADNRYTHTATASPTNFKRLVIIQPAAGSETKRVLSEVSWTQGSNTYVYTLETHLTNWRPE